MILTTYEAVQHAIFIWAAGGSGFGFLLGYLVFRRQEAQPQSQDAWEHLKNRTNSNDPK